MSKATKQTSLRTFVFEYIDVNLINANSSSAQQQRFDGFCSFRFFAPFKGFIPMLYDAQRHREGPGCWGPLIPGLPVQYLYDTNIKVRLQSGASHVSLVVHLFDCIFTQEHNYQYRAPLVKASKPSVLTRD